MSLQLAAQHLSHQGRGGDSTLVHMSPREVKSLNDLAMAHGGQLSINPQTGLPEAGFLSSILPMVAGFALGPAGFGLSAAQAGLAAGALGFAMTGSLQKGLMAGLGAYGGAGIGGSLTEVGMDAAVASDSASKLARDQIAENAANVKFYDPAGSLAPSMKDEYIKTQLGAANQSAAAQAAARSTAEAAYKELPFMEKMGKSFDTLTSPGGASGLFDKVTSSPMSLLKTVGSAASPAIDEANKPKPIEETKGDADMGQRYGFSMNPTSGQRQVQPGQDPLANTQSPTTTPLPDSQFDSSEKSYFAPSYTKLTPEQAKSMYGYAEGGTAQANPQPATETPAMQMFKQMQAQRAAQPAAPQIDANAQYADYLKQTRAAPVQSKAPTASTTTGDGFLSSLGLADNPLDYSNLSESEKNRGGIYGSGGTGQNPGTEFIYDPIKQTYTKNPNFAAAEPAEDAFNIENRPVVGYDRNGQKIYGERRGYGAHWTGGMGSFRAAGGLLDAYAGGGMSNLGDYSDGGRLLRGPGDGVSDSIPAMIGKRQPARLADGEFVVPARIVSELGNGSTEAGARKLYAMMDRIQKARGKTVGKGKVAKNSRSEKYLPA